MTMMRMIRQTCGVTLKDELPCVELQQELGIQNAVTVQQSNKLFMFLKSIRVSKKIYRL